MVQLRWAWQTVTGQSLSRPGEWVCGNHWVRCKHAGNGLLHTEVMVRHAERGLACGVCERAKWMTGLETAGLESVPEAEGIERYSDAEYNGL